MPKVFNIHDSEERVQADIRELLYAIAKALTAFDQLGRTEAQGRVLEFERQRMRDLEEEQ